VGRLGRRQEVSPLARQTARALGAGRVALGTAMVAAPGTVTRRWLGPETEDDPGRAIAVRGLGARDVVLGIGLLTALRSGVNPRRAARWLEAGVVADLADAASTLVEGVEDTDRTAAVGLALGAAALGTVVRSGLR
jgi:hypothetical protein